MTSAAATGAPSAQKIIERARHVTDPVRHLQLPCELAHGHMQDVSLHFYSGCDLPTSERAWVLDSIRRDLRPLYEASAMGWDEAEKAAEVRHKDQRYMIAMRADEGRRLAFLSYRWDVEEGRAIMYVYEVGVEEEMRGRGMASAMMLYVEEMCRRQQVFCVMLTVFVKNRAAMALYIDKLGYVVDDDSPSKHGYEGVGYEILSKLLI